MADTPIQRDQWVTDPSPPPFRPRGLEEATPAGQVPLTVSAAVQQVSLPPSVQYCGGAIRIVNQGGTGVAWCYGNNGNLTLSNGEFMLPDTVETFQIPRGYTQLSVIGASAAGTFRVHAGEGQ